MDICVDYDGDIMAKFPQFIFWLLFDYMLVISWLYDVYCLWLLKCLMNM